MEVRKVKNKQGEILTTREGVELEKLYFEPGDEFVPLFNRVLEKSREVEVEEKGKMQKRTITNYSLKCKVRDRNKENIKHNGTDEIFVELTPAQAESLKKKTEEGIELNQNLFVAYNYKSKNFGEQIGLGLKKANKPAKTFEELDRELANTTNEKQTSSETSTTSADNKDNKGNNENKENKENNKEEEAISEQPIKIEDIE